jgi:hypothetical protein
MVRWADVEPLLRRQNPKRLLEARSAGFFDAGKFLLPSCFPLGSFLSQCRQAPKIRQAILASSKRRYPVVPCSRSSIHRRKAAAVAIVCLNAEIHQLVFG